MCELDYSWKNLTEIRAGRENSGLNMAMKWGGGEKKKRKDEQKEQEEEEEAPGPDGRVIGIRSWGKGSL